MSKDNREECPDCKEKGYINSYSPEKFGSIPNRIASFCYWHNDTMSYRELCTTCDGTGEVTIDSGADVKQDVLDLKICLSTISGYHPDNYATQLLLTKAMKLIDKLNPITIKGELDEYKAII